MDTRKANMLNSRAVLVPPLHWLLSEKNKWDCQCLDMLLTNKPGQKKDFSR